MASPKFGKLPIDMAMSWGQSEFFKGQGAPLLLVALSRSADRLPEFEQGKLKEAGIPVSSEVTVAQASLNELAGYLNVTNRAVRKQLEKAERYGLIKKIENSSSKGHSTLYVIGVPPEGTPKAQVIGVPPKGTPNNENRYTKQDDWVYLEGSLGVPSDSMTGTNASYLESSINYLEEAQQEQSSAGVLEKKPPLPECPNCMTNEHLIPLPLPNLAECTKCGAAVRISD